MILLYMWQEPGWDENSREHQRAADGWSWSGQVPAPFLHWPPCPQVQQITIWNTKLDPDSNVGPDPNKHWNWQMKGFPRLLPFLILGVWGKKFVRICTYSYFLLVAMSPVLHVEGSRTFPGSVVVGRCHTGLPLPVIFVAFHLVFVVVQ